MSISKHVSQQQQKADTKKYHIETGNGNLKKLNISNNATFQFLLYVPASLRIDDVPETWFLVSTLLTSIS